MGFFIIYVSLSILKISGKSKTWSPEPARFAMEHTIYNNNYILSPFIDQNGPITVEAKGVTCMNNDPAKVHILYAGIVDEDGHLQELTEKIVNYFVEQGEKLNIFLHCETFF